ncbi:AsmA family protein, partial [Escherichia coli]|uniref:AsmA family protein n=1 Tax=Escherichia coli TaxID=562 RepID=UPI002118AB4F
NAAGFGEAPMLVVVEADVGLRLLPLVMHREIQIGKVSLTGMKLNLAKNAEGVSNWDDLAKGSPDQAKPEGKPGEGPGIKS